MITLDPNQETCVVITIPPNKHGYQPQVLVRLPGHIDPSLVTVDFRHDPQGVWTPSDFFADSVEVRHQ